MLTFDDLTPGLRLEGLASGGPATLLAVERRSANAVSLTYRDEASGEPHNEVFFRTDLQRLRSLEGGYTWTFDADAALFQHAAEAQRIRFAHQFDPRLAVHISDVEPLPHQIAAVYDDMLPRQPLKFLLADDPGAGKTIMAGLLIRELILRGDVERCLIVTPANLAEQWQDELQTKFEQNFEIASRAMLNDSASGNPFNDHDLLIGRIDLLKQEDALQLLQSADEWDLIVVDEAHKMSAHRYGNRVNTSQRYRLGLELAEKTRHFLLMTATPHSGNQDDFQLFMRLLDADRFEGLARGAQAPPADASDLMRRVLKEHLTDFDGSKLFPERIASTVNYDLSEAELELYEAVTQYVREEMNRADKLLTGQLGRRRNAVGFALTILQRRLASSPAAIHKSLERRLGRLKQRLSDLRRISENEDLQRALQSDLPLFALGGGGSDQDMREDLEDLEERPEEELSELLDLASAAGSIEELKHEVDELKRLERLANKVRRSGDDRKWEQLSTVLDYGEMFDARGARRKLVIFTEHRDTLDYLVGRIRTKLGRGGEAVVAIHGGLQREARQSAQHAFVNDPRALVLVATDAAGEGVNLQRAHLMVNYDLPWNPNRIEQRFGRIHRFGQREVCHLWNLVAHQTREGAVLERLLLKLEEERSALGDQVFDVLGEAFTEVSLRDLMIDAIRYGQSDEARAKAAEQIELRWNHDDLKQLVDERALGSTTISPDDVHAIKAEMDRAQARRLVPHYIEQFFIQAFRVLGGRITAREAGRHEITRVPPSLRRAGPGGRRARPAERYERVCFDRAQRSIEGRPQAAFLAPGHILLDALVERLLQQHGALLTRGATLVDPSEEAQSVRAMVAIENEIHDGRSTSRGGRHTVWRSIDYVEIDEQGKVVRAGPAPYLDYQPVPEQQRARAAEIANADWLRGAALESIAVDYALENLVQPNLEQLRGDNSALLDKIEREVNQRLRAEIAYWDRRAHEIKQRELQGQRPKLNSANARRRADELEARLQARRAEIGLQRRLQPQNPRIVGASVVIPAHMLEPGRPAPDPSDRRRIEQIAMQAVLEYEHSRGREPTDVSAEQLGWDIQSSSPDGAIRYIEVKGRRADADSITLTRNEQLQALNLGEKFWLAVVHVEGQQHAPPIMKQGPFEEEFSRGLINSSFNIAKLMEDAAPYKAQR